MKDMVSKSHAKRRQDIKTKLMAAIAMLLVSSIMMVSSTYAWFTLSTAPEVTGISTSVGANGNLEMALLPTNANVKNVSGGFGITSEAGDGNKTLVQKNTTWGNLVELTSSEGGDVYGLGQITLNPAAINMKSSNEVQTGGFLKIPTYGSDGRVKELVANTVTATYGESAFVMNTNYGVRAIGASSGMSERQYSFRNALNTADGFFSQANSLAAVSITNNGSVVGQIAIKHANDANAPHTRAELLSIQTMVNDLEASVAKIEEAYKYYLLVYAASSENAYGKTDEEINASDAKWMAVKGWVEAPGSTLESVLTNINSATENKFEIPDALESKLTELAATKANVVKAKNTIASLLAKENKNDDYTWAELTSALNVLINTNEITVNEYKIDKVKENIGDLAKEGKVTIKITTGGGVYADVADHSGNYAANILVDVQYGTMKLDDFPARMEVATTKGPYSTALYTAASKLIPENKAATNAEVTISEFYGYIIDLAFRTNAASSNLLLRTNPSDRIYSDNNNVDTMGHGSTVTFETLDGNFTGANMKELMKNIRLVFFNPDGGKVYAYAAIDADNAVVAGTTVTANIYLVSSIGTNVTYELVGNKSYDATAKYFTMAYQYDVATGINAENFDPATLYLKQPDDSFKTVTEAENAGAAFDSDKTYYVRSEVYTAVEPTFTENATDEQKLTEGNNWLNEMRAAGKVICIQKTTDTGAASGFIKNESEAVITALTQNEAKAVSVLVYLDGNTITNADVAATVVKSMTGSLNLQFASSANLKPMEYADLHQNGGATTYDVTVPAGVTGNAKATANTAYTFTVGTGYTLGTVTVGGTAVTPTAGENGSYTIPADKVTGAIVINVTATGTGA